MCTDKLIFNLLLLTLTFLLILVADDKDHCLYALQMLQDLLFILIELI